MIIKRDALEDGAVISLLAEHHAEMHLYSPPESIHALGVASLKDSGVKFWSAWFADALAGCGALKELSGSHGEIKSMRTARSFLRKGVAEKILQQILTEAKSCGYQYVSLETGTHDAFLPAIKLYQKFGFKETGPFASYQADPFSTFFTLEIGVAESTKFEQ